MLSVTFAYLIGVHLINRDLYNHHPIVEVNDTLSVYQNSFEKTSIALYKKFELEDFKFRLGVASGYKRRQVYKNDAYVIPSVTKSGIGLFVVPSYERGVFVLAILGDSINAGLKWNFK